MALNIYENDIEILRKRNSYYIKKQRIVRKRNSCKVKKERSWETRHFGGIEAMKITIYLSGCIAYQRVAQTPRRLRRLQKQDNLLREY